MGMKSFCMARLILSGEEHSKPSVISLKVQLRWKSIDEEKDYIKMGFKFIDMPGDTKKEIALYTSLKMI